MQLRSSLAALADLVLPRACLGCGRAGTSWCAPCRPRDRPLTVAAGGLDVRAAGSYEGALRAVLIAYKERGRRDLAVPLGELLAHAVQPAGGVRARGTPSLVLVPVPSSTAAVRDRGSDHLLRLAQLAARMCGLRVVQAVHLGRAVADSAGLGRCDRARNLHGALWSAPAPAGLRAIVVDDIVTTGATLQETRRALLAAGWPVHGAAVVAATPRHTR